MITKDICKVKKENYLGPLVKRRPKNKQNNFQLDGETFNH